MAEGRRQRPAGGAERTPSCPRVSEAADRVRLGLAANWPQFTLLVVVNAFVGGMVGLERTTTSLVGTRVFHLTGYLAAFSFIVAFGVTKALTNLAAGPLTARHTRKSLLVAGWAAGLPVPFLLAWAPAWGWIVAANVALGVNQGLAWPMTVNMKIDLVGPRGRGLALGFNEAAGYMAVGATALATGYLAAAYGLGRGSRAAAGRGADRRGLRCGRAGAVRAGGQGHRRARGRRNRRPARSRPGNGHHPARSRPGNGHNPVRATHRRGARPPPP